VGERSAPAAGSVSTIAKTAEGFFHRDLSTSKCPHFSPYKSPRSPLVTLLVGVPSKWTVRDCWMYHQRCPEGANGMSGVSASSRVRPVSCAYQPAAEREDTMAISISNMAAMAPLTDGEAPDAAGEAPPVLTAFSCGEAEGLWRQHEADRAWIEWGICWPPLSVGRPRCRRCAVAWPCPEALAAYSHMAACHHRTAGCGVGDGPGFPPAVAAEWGVAAGWAHFDARAHRDGVSGL